MPRAKALEYYPEVFRDLLRKAMTGNKTLLLPFADKFEATKFRGQFYAFVGALKQRAREIQTAKAGGLPPTLSEVETLNDALLSERCMVELRFTGPKECKLAFLPREHSWQAKKIMQLEEGEEHGAGPRIAESGQVVDAAELSAVELIVMQLESPADLDQERTVAELRQHNPQWIERHEKLQHAIALWEAARSLPPKTDMEKRVAERLAGYGMKPTGGLSK